MGVYIKKRIKAGWKAKENDRYGGCLVVIFCDDKTDKELFHWAPNLHEKEFILEMWKDLELYDQLHKATLSIEEKISMSQTTKPLKKEVCKK